MTELRHPAGARAAPAGTLREIAEDVYAYLQPPGGWCLNNAGVLVGPDGVVVVDTVATRPRAQRLAHAVAGLGAGPVRTVVNTHHHGDHTFGNDAFGGQVPIVAHELARVEMAETGLALTGLWPQVAWGEIRLTLPTVTFTDRMTLHLGDQRVELIHVGPAHTTNDVVVWLPDRRVLFAGDVVLPGCTPFNLMGSISGAIDAVARLAALRPAVVVGGHGQPGGPETFEATLAYLRWVQRIAAEGRRRGASPLTVAMQTPLGEFAGLLDPERLVGNLHRAYAELEGGPPGRPLDVAPIFGEMIAYNGGTVPTCLA